MNELEKTTVGDVDYYYNMLQNSDAWYDIRSGKITASTMNLILSPKLAVANNEKSRTHYFELASQRIKKVETDHFMSWDMARGHIEEKAAREVYEREYAPVKECGFIINNKLGFPVGFSPDGLVGEDGLIEIKSRVAKYQIQTIHQHMANHEGDPIPTEFMLQVQTSLWVTGREWCDFISYSNGLNMIIIRCTKMDRYQEAIEDAAKTAEEKINSIIDETMTVMQSKRARVHPVEWIDHNADIVA